MRLQVPECLGAEPQPLEPLGLLVCDRGGGGPVAQLAVVRDGGVALALPAQRPGLMLHDSLEPGDQLVFAGARRLREQDFDPALEGVLGVLRRDRVTSRGGQDLPTVPRQQPECASSTASSISPRAGLVPRFTISTTFR